MTDTNEITTHLLEILKVRVNNSVTKSAQTADALQIVSADLQHPEISEAEIPDNSTRIDESSCETADDSSSSGSSSSSDSDMERGKTPSKRAKHMRRKREKKLLGFTKLKKLREEKLKSK